MTKAELLHEMYREHAGELPARCFVENTFSALCSVIRGELLDGGEISLPGLGKLKAKKYASRQGHNPKTGEVLTIPGGLRVGFAPGKEFKEALKG